MGRVDLVVRVEGAFVRLFAMKRLLPQLVGEQDAKARFLEEAQIAARLRHVNIVSVVDIGSDGEGPFMLMDFVPGVSLAQHIAALQRADELIPVEVLLEITRQAAAALVHAHDAGVVHRDVTPSNLLLGVDGVVRLTDFGIAKLTSAGNPTTAGIVKGKWGYLAPEQLRFEEVDARTDLYTLGIGLHEALTTERLYDGVPAEVAQRILAEPPPDVGEFRRDLPAEVSELIFDLLAKDRAARPTAAELLERTNAILESLPTTSTHTLAEHLQTHHHERFDDQKGWRDEASASLAVAPRRPSKGVWVGVAATTAILGAVLAGYARTEPAAPSPSPPDLVAERAPPEPMVEEAPVAVPEDPPVEERADAPEEVPSMSTRRRRRRPSGEPSSEAAPSGVETWSWDD